MYDIFNLLQFIYGNIEDVFLEEKTSSMLPAIVIKEGNMGKIYYIDYSNNFKKSTIEVDLREKSNMFNLKIDDCWLYYCDYGINKFVNVSYKNKNNSNYTFLFSCDITTGDLYTLTINPKLKIIIEEEAITNVSMFTEEFVFYLKLKEVI